MDVASLTLCKHLSFIIQEQNFPRFSVHAVLRDKTYNKVLSLSTDSFIVTKIHQHNSKQYLKQLSSIKVKFNAYTYTFCDQNGITITDNYSVCHSKLALMRQTLFDKQKRSEQNKDDIKLLYLMWVRWR